MSGPAPARLAAWRALVRVSAGAVRLDDSHAALPELEGLADNDRRLATELVTGTVKRRLSIDAVLSSFAASPLARVRADVLEALRLSAYQLLFLDRVPAHAAVDDGVELVARRGKRTRGFVNAVLRGVAREGRGRFETLAGRDDVDGRAVRWSCPPWLVELLERDLGGAAAAQLLAAANDPPERCLRVNTLRGDVATAAVSLEAAGFSVAGVPALPEALRYEGPPLEASRPFRDGLVTAQSRGSQLAGLVAARGVTEPRAILDLCAAPGTKTSQLAAAYPGVRLVACDADAQRLDVLRANLRRLDVRGVDVVHADATSLPDTFTGVFDLVLVDAPCSGFGTLGTRPDARWRRRPADIERLAAAQHRLLAGAARCVRAGGALTYAVCTVTAAETLGVVDELVRSGPWELDDLGTLVPDAAHPANGAFLRTLPPAWGSTAFFVARLRRPVG